MLKQYYTPEEVAVFNAGIDELQAIPVTHANYTELGLSTAGGTGAAWEDASHEAWHGRPLTELAAERQQNRIDMLICGTPKFDRVVRDPKMLAIHTELAGGQCMLSNNYYIEKHGPCHGGGLHHGGFPRMRTFRYGYDHTTQKFDCCECSLVQLSCPGFLASLTEQLPHRLDQGHDHPVRHEHDREGPLRRGPWLAQGGARALTLPCLPPSSDVRGWCGSLQNLDPRKALDLSDATKTYLCEPVFADAGDGECGNGSAWPVLPRL